MTMTPSPHPAEAKEREAIIGQLERVADCCEQDVSEPKDAEWMRKAATLLRASHAPAAAAASGEAVYLVATGEVHEGSDTYTRHDTPPPLCDFEKLYAKANPAAGAEPEQWRSLTDREWVNIVNSDEVKYEGSDVHGAVCAAFKLIEKRLREKNEPIPSERDAEDAALQQRLERLAVDAKQIFSGCAQNPDDVIEWYAASIRVELDAQREQSEKRSGEGK